MESIAIIGMVCRFPGGADSLDKFWDVLTNGKDTTSDVQGDRWDIERFYDPDKSKPGKTYTIHGGFLDNIDQFDAAFFWYFTKRSGFFSPLNSGFFWKFPRKRWKMPELIPRNWRNGSQ